MSYVDGYIIPVPLAQKAAYLTMATKMAAIFTENGALRIVETWGDDVPRGKTTDFWGAVKCEEGEGLVFSWIEWPSKAARDTGMQKAMQDPRMKGEAPFDGKRMIFGGFMPMLDTAQKA
jgi:uncharacterized protein YbaA (DUF1428 family)